ncbi:hypothetical protein IMY05_007G0112200 [Salix suchowensis]|nr:hypothetical protein IMY05_007G0112200 [Salix suchowensis]
MWCGGWGGESEENKKKWSQECHSKANEHRNEEPFNFEKNSIVQELARWFLKCFLSMKMVRASSVYWGYPNHYPLQNGKR